MDEIRLIFGGSGSGKSDFAESLLSDSPEKIYLATMRRDKSAIRRIERHIRRRADKGFTTIESTGDFSKAGIPEGSDVLLEDLPNLLANAMFPSDGGVCHEAYEKVVSDIEFLMKRSRRLIIVSDDIFESGTDYDFPTEEYMRALGRIHTFLAERGKVTEIIAGIRVDYN